MGNSFTCEVQKEFFDAICDGKKTVEGRLKRDKWANMRADDYLFIYCEGKSIKRQIIKVTEHKDIAEFLALHLKEALPGKTLEEGIKIYKQDCNYGDQEKDFGVVGIWLSGPFISVFRNGHVPSKI